MSRPQLNRHLMLEHETRVPDGSGGFVTQWAVLGAHWAQIKSGSGRAASGAGTAISRVNFRITVRAAPITSDARPKAGQRFRGHGQIYAISAVSEIAPNGRYLLCHATQETAL